MALSKGVLLMSADRLARLGVLTIRALFVAEPERAFG